MSISYTEVSLPAQRFYLVHSIFPNQAAHDRAHKYDAYRFGKKASYQGFGSKEENSGCMVLFVIVIALVGVGLLG
jgi:hypothetical protein